LRVGEADQGVVARQARLRPAARGQVVLARVARRVAAAPRGRGARAAALVKLERPAAQGVLIPRRPS